MPRFSDPARSRFGHRAGDDWLKAVSGKKRMNKPKLGFGAR
jgi:hypothetical protein